MPDDLARRYRAEGWWTDATLGGMVADGLAGQGRAGFEVHSRVRPVEGHLRRRRPGGPVAGRRPPGPGGRARATWWSSSCPNWLEAGITFWAAAYLGAVVVPIVHFYGAKEVDYILRVTSPDVVVTADRFGHSDYLATYCRLLGRSTGPAVAGGRGHARPGQLPGGGHRLRLDARRPTPSPRRPTVDPDAPAIIGFTSGTTRDPKGVVHSHRTIGCETRQLDYMFPRGGPPQITGAPVGHFIGMLNAFLMPAAARPPRPPARRVGPGRGAAPDAARKGSACPEAPPTS